MFRIRFWGVRGSIPAPGASTVDVGGNTSCVGMTCGDTRIVFDGGTGLRVLGTELAPSMPVTVHLFFSHVHWDHIQGFPFFGPAFVPGNTIHMYGNSNSRGTIESTMAGQMEGPNFPVKLSELASELVFHDISAGETVELPGGVRVSAANGQHPGGVLAYRVDYEGSSAVYATDTEHDEAGLDPAFVDLCRDADVLIYDAMYTPEEYAGEADGRSRVGWGHSTFVAGAELAKAAEVKRFILFHHDPDQDDAAVADKERRARELFENSEAAREGMTIEL